MPVSYFMRYLLMTFLFVNNMQIARSLRSGGAIHVLDMYWNLWETFL